MATKTSVDYVATQIVKMANQGASEAEIDIYLTGKGFSSRDQYLKRLKRFRDRKEQAGDTDADFGFFDSVLQGLTLGFSDEIGSVIDAGEFSGPDYDRQMAARKFAREDYEEENPGMALTGEILGGLAPGLLTGGAGLALAGGKTAIRQGGKMGLGRLIGTEAAAGGTSGAIAGAGTADPGQRGEGAKLGGALGAGAGVLLPTVGTGVKAGFNKARTGLGLVGKEESEDLAKRKLLGALERDQVTPQQVIEQIPEGPGVGPIDESVIDLAGENTLGLARASQAIPGRSKEMGREALVERAEGQYDRVSDYLIEASGRPQQDVFQLIEEIVERRKATAGPLYQKSFEEAPLESSIVNDLLESPLMKKSITKASADLGPGEAPITIDSPISFQNLHSIKMSLDDDISESFRSGQKNRGSKLMDAKRTLLDEMDSQNDLYREARDIFAGDSALKDAIDAGRDFWKQDPRLTTKQINKLSDSERDMYLSGAMDSIRQLMDRAADSRDLVKVIFGNRQFRDKIRAVTKTDDAFETLKSQMEREANAKRTQDVVLGGSPTARIQAEMMDLNAAPQILADLLMPQTTVQQSIASRVAQPVVRKVQEKTQGRVTDAMAPMLFDMRPESQRRTMRELLDFQKELDRRGNMSRRNMIYGAGASGALPGLLMNQN